MLKGVKKVLVMPGVVGVKNSILDKIRVDQRDRDCQIGRLVVEAGIADRTIVVVASVIVVMKGNHED